MLAHTGYQRYCSPKDRDPSVSFARGYLLGLYSREHSERGISESSEKEERLGKFLLRDRITDRLRSHELMVGSFGKRIASLSEIVAPEGVSVSGVTAHHTGPSLSSSLWRSSQVLATKKDAIAVLLFLHDVGEATLDTLKARFQFSSEDAIRLLAALLAERVVILRNDTVAETLRGRDLASKLRRRLKESP